MPFTIEIIPDPDQGGSKACLPNIPAYGEGETENEAIDGLKEASRDYVETFGVDDALNHFARHALRSIELNFVEVTTG